MFKFFIHPFDDENGRIARALSDMLLARSEDSHLRFYSFSNQMLKERKEYYQVLQKVQFSGSDITEWIEWFLWCLYRAMQSSEEKTREFFGKQIFGTSIKTQR